MSSHHITSAGTTARAGRISILLGALALVVSTGCGDDPPSAERPKRGARSRTAAKPAVAKKKGPSVQAYPKIDDAVRRTFLEKDFRPDPQGDRNRDPFRSYIIRQPGTSEAQVKSGGGKDEVCKNTERKENWKATTYSLRNLKLIGIIVRGTKGYAQFVDSTGDAVIVSQGNCLGVEKAIVTSVSEGVVSLLVRPDPPIGGKPPPPVQRDIALYPEDKEIQTSDDRRR